MARPAEIRRPMSRSAVSVPSTATPGSGYTRPVSNVIRRSTVQRRSGISSMEFPFEILHADGPANNMRHFHWHEFMEISHVRRGVGTYEIEDRVYTVGPGDFVVINNIERHRVTFEPRRPLYETVMHFSPELVSPPDDEGLDARYLRLFLLHGASFSNKPVLSQYERGAMARVVTEIRSEYDHRGPLFQPMIRAQLLTLITYLMRCCGVSDQVDNARAGLRRTNIERLNRISSYIRDNFADRMELNSLAERFAMSSSYFSDYFRRNIGVTLTEYVNQVRIDEATRLLIQTDMNVIDIAFECGFGTTAAFYRAFRKSTGRSPGSMRRRAGDDRASVELP